MYGWLLAPRIQHQDCRGTPLVASSYLWSPYCEPRFPRALRSHREVLGTVSGYATAFNDATNTFGDIDIKSLNQYDSVFNGTASAPAAYSNVLCIPSQLYNVPLVSRTRLNGQLSDYIFLQYFSAVRLTSAASSGSFL